MHAETMLCEDEIIYEIFLKGVSPGKGYLVPPGDDAAVVSLAGDAVITTDMLVEGVHFDLSYYSPGDVGFKAVSVNASDLASMGAVPHSCFISVGFPRDTGREFVEGVAAGIREGLACYGMCMGGGDTVRSDVLVISVTAVGTVDGKPLTRSGAAPCDRIYLSGMTGLSHVGMKILSAGAKNGGEGFASRAAAHHLRPVAEVEVGLFLRERCIATSCIDTSDGLVKDLGRVLSRSGVGAVIREDAFAFEPEFRETAARFGFTPIDVALYGGEDFRLLFTVPQDRECDLALAPGRENFILLGEVSDRKGIFILRDGVEHEIGGTSDISFEHFSRGGG